MASAARQKYFLNPEYKKMSLSPLVINLDVVVDASGSVSVFGSPEYTPVNKVVPLVTLPVADFYVDASDAMFEFQEGETRGDRVGKLAKLEGRDYTRKAGKFANDLQAVLEGEMDASAAAPFSGYAAAGHKIFPNFGELTLALYAHHLMGHVAATAAITNDVAIIRSALSRDSADAYTHSSANGLSKAELEAMAAAPGSASDFDLARRLVGQILTKDGEATGPAVKAIVDQVLRDANRALNEDNSAYAPGDWAALKFIAGDRICMQITLEAPAVTVESDQVVTASAIKGRYPTGASDKVNPDTKQFTLVILLA
jgi:hypothetical protein